MKRTLTILTTTALAAGLAFVQPAVTHPKSRAMARQRMEQALSLTTQQRSQAKQIFQQARQSARPLVSQPRRDRAALAAAIKSNDRAQIDRLPAERGEILGKPMAARSEARAQVYQLLTPEQRAKAAQLRQEWRQKRARG